MQTTAQTIKEKMLEFARLFSIERGIFQRSVIIYKYVRFLNKDPLAKDVLQKIFNDTAKFMGEEERENMNEEQFLAVKGSAIFTHNFWMYYSNLELIHKRMRSLRQCNIDDKASFEQLCLLFSKPYSEQMLELSFTVVNSEIFERLDRACFFKVDEQEEKTCFKEQKSILLIKGEKIMISKQDKVTNAHKILRHIFITNKDNVRDDFYYAEIAEEEFGEIDYTSNPTAWEKYHDACKYINRLVEEQTKDHISDFLIFNTGQKGRVKVNAKHL